jgi:RNase_H superfamily
LIVSEDQEVFHSFWSDCITEESEAFSQFADEISRLDDFRVLHFGDYEITALRRMRSQLPPQLQSRIDLIVERSTNVLSVIHPHIYFPTYSNSLKDIGRFLGFQRTDADASGLESIIWRDTWNESHAEEVKARLLKKRLQKSGEKMFTFLDHDGVPWNNNNAEHAIKRFARYRRDADGRFTERTLEEYLVLASVFETCEFNNVNVLRFLLSKEATLKGLLGMAGH